MKDVLTAFLLGAYHESLNAPLFEGRHALNLNAKWN